MTYKPSPSPFPTTKSEPAEPAQHTYANPILFADYSDPDVIRVGQDYWMTASSFCCVPGLPILHSRDLVNWRLVNHALPRLPPEHHYATHRAGCGVWAPSIRFHDNRFWIFFPDPDFGLYCITASDPLGNWSEPRLLKPGKGLIDPCPIWTDGKAYLVHGWAKSRSGICNLLTLHEMAPDASSLIDDGQIIIDGTTETPWNTIEGPKLYQRDGWFWVFAPAGGVATGFQAVFRSRNIRGPYEARNVLHQGDTPVNGPHQGGWTNTPDGQDWFIHFQERQPFGRIVHLQPMRWRPDGWPVMGHDPSGTGTGSPVLTYPIPALSPSPKSEPPRSDSFPDGSFGKQWQWQANPAPEWRIQDSNLPGLNLRCIPRTLESNFWAHGPLLLQKLVGPSSVASVTIDLHAGAVGDAAGLIVFGYDYFSIALVKRESSYRVEAWDCRDAQNGSPEHLHAAIATTETTLSIRLQTTPEGICLFSIALADAPFEPFATPFTARESKWVGAKFGLFAANLSGHSSTGRANFTSFSVL